MSFASMCSVSRWDDEVVASPNWVSFGVCFCFMEMCCSGLCISPSVQAGTSLQPAARVTLN